MTLGLLDAPSMDRFDAICRMLSARGKGLTLSQIGDAGALARELEKTDPDVERVERLGEQIGLDAAEIDAEAHAT